MRVLNLTQRPKAAACGVPRHRQQGVISLIEMAVLLGALMALVIALTYKSSDYFTKNQSLGADALLQMADHQLRQYAVANGRLPCPDLNADGYADDDVTGNCNGQQKGYLPYKTLGMTDKNYVYGEVPILYGVYSAGGVSFTSRAQTFFPTYQDKSNNPVQVANPRGVFDFCATLSQLKQQSSPAAAGLGVTDGTVQYNAVYALAQAGSGDLDGTSPGWNGGPTINAQYDGRNASSPNWFEMPQSSVGTRYDDRTFFRAAPDLYDYYRCDAMNSSISVMTEAVTVQKETEDFADSNSGDATKGLVINAIGIAIATWELLQTFADIAEAGEEIGIASALLATVTATCPLPPWVTCALIPVYATAEVDAQIGLGLAIASSATAAASLGLNITATVLYADLKSRTSTAPSDPTTSTSNISSDQLKTLLSTYVTDKNKAITAYAKLPQPAPTQADITAAQTDRNNKLAAINSNINAVTDSTLQTALYNNLNGSSSSCTPPASNNCSGYTARQVPKTDSNGNVLTNADGSPQMTTIYTQDNLAGTPYSPGLVPSLDNYYGALAQSGTPTGSTTAPAGADQATINAINNSNSGLSSASTVNPTTALNSANSVLNNYSQLLANTATFDTANLAMVSAQTAYQAAVSTYGSGSAQAISAGTALTSASTARETARQNLGNSMGNPSWNTSTTTSLCGGGSTSGCGWMNNTGGSAGNSTTLASTGSSATNAFLNSNANYQSLQAYKALKSASDSANNNAWSDRNSLKTALCAVQTPSAQFVGSTSLPSNDPNSWDQNENVLVTDGSGVPTPVGLNCVGGSPTDTSSNNSAAASAEQTKYCTPGSTYDATLCALYTNAAAAVRSTIRGASTITNTVIQKGIAK